MVRNSGHINPFAMTIGFAKALEDEGVTIFENTKALSLEKSGSGWKVTTANGAVFASKVVLATNALTDKLWPGLQQTLIPFKVFQAATEPLLDELRSRILVGSPAVSDMRNDLRYFHYDCDNRLVSGGTHSLWHNEAERGRNKVAKLLKKAFSAFDQTPKITEYWHGTFAVVPDRSPRLYRLSPGLVFGGVYSGRGVALSMSLGQAIGRWAIERDHDDQMPLPITDMQPVQFHQAATQIANRIHVWNRIKDALT